MNLLLLSGTNYCWIFSCKITVAKITLIYYRIGGRIKMIISSNPAVDRIKINPLLRLNFDCGLKTCIATELYSLKNLCLSQLEHKKQTILGKI